MNGFHFFERRKSNKIVRMDFETLNITMIMNVFNILERGRLNDGSHLNNKDWFYRKSVKNGESYVFICINNASKITIKNKWRKIPN